MIGTVFDKVAGYVGPRVVLTFLLPVTAVAAATGALVATEIGWTRAGDWWARRTAAAQVAGIVGAVAVLVFVALLLSANVLTLTRLYEGYWGGVIGRRFAALGRWRQLRRFDRLDLQDDEAFERRYRSFPARRDDVLPTRLGNVFRSAETYPSESGRYGMDAVFFWPRLTAVIPDGMRALLADARSSVNLMIAMSFLSGAFALGCAIYLVVGPAAPLAWAVGLVLGLLVSRQAALGAVAAATTYAELVRTSFDLYRHDLLKQFGLALPDSMPAERELWQNLGEQLYRRLASNPDVIVYPKDGGT